MFFVCHDGVAGVDALGREAEEEVVPHREAPVLEHGQHRLARGAGVGRRLEDDELAGPERRADRLGRRDDVAQVRVLGLAERRGHADRDRVALGEARHVRRGDDPAVRRERRQLRRGHVADVAVARVHAVGDRGAHLEPEDLVAGLGDLDGEREPDVPEADHADDGGLVLDPGEKLFLGGHNG